MTVIDVQVFLLIWPEWVYITLDWTIEKGFISTEMPNIIRKAKCNVPTKRYIRFQIQWENQGSYRFMVTLLLKELINKAPHFFLLWGKNVSTLSLFSCFYFNVLCPGFNDLFYFAVDSSRWIAGIYLNANIPFTFSHSTSQSQLCLIHWMEHQSVKSITFH